MKAFIIISAILFTSCASVPNAVPIKDKTRKGYAYQYADKQGVNFRKGPHKNTGKFITAFVIMYVVSRNP